MYAILNADTNKGYKKVHWGSVELYETERGAKTACTKLSKKFPVTNWKVITVKELRAIPVKMVERTNLMSGQTYMEAEGTPNYCSPASEAYWSM